MIKTIKEDRTAQILIFKENEYVENFNDIKDSLTFSFTELVNLITDFVITRMYLEPTSCVRFLYRLHEDVLSIRACQYLSQDESWKYTTQITVNILKKKDLTIS